MSEENKEKKKSLIARIMSFGARDKASKAPRAKFLDKEKINKFKLKRK